MTQPPIPTTGPLVGVRIVEFASLGPGPFASMFLADMGADVVRIDRPSPVAADDAYVRALVLNRGRRSISLDLKNPADRATALQLVERADALIEGYRPGVMERLGVGPDPCLQRNPRLVYARITGWGQDGPLAQTAGHDINYLARSGVLNAIRRPGDRPVPPLNLIADFAGGGMLAVAGLLCGLLETSRSGQGQVIDIAMIDGIASLSAAMWMLRALGAHNDPPGMNVFDGGAPYDDTYETRDGRHVAVGAMEPEFYARMCELTGLDGSDLGSKDDRTAWPGQKRALAALFLERSLDEWLELVEGSDACISPVLSFDEAPDDAHVRARNTFVEVDGIVQPAPAPRFSRTPGSLRQPPARQGEHSKAVLADWLALDG